ncbi:Abi-alpha family protein [Sorangium sp. So ce693]|uniref:Abi-alpha family protein n=1 Tax=Sorangium sp. So ce693 TaxID=3133318 RepID=UPI003F62C431
MSDEKSVDLLGIKPGAEAVKIATEGAVSGIGAFLSRICLPVAEEFGLLLQDRVRWWRAKNATNTLEHARRLMPAQPGAEPIGAHPQLAHKIIEESSWTEDDELQQMWAGLLVSACSKTGKDETNKIFIEILSKLTRSQARILQHACTKAPKQLSPNGLILAEEFTVNLKTLQEISGIDDIHQLDHELDHLREIGLLNALNGGFPAESIDLNAGLTPTSLALNMYVRCRGARQSPIEFFALKENKPHGE